jgi:hypothetical protein
MIYDKKYYLCEGYNTKKLNDKIIYYHQPKSGGTSVSNIFLSLFIKPYRILGTHIKRYYDKSEYENLLDNVNNISKNNYDFICGHINFLDFFKDRFSITTIRDPIDRAISHYNMLFENKVIDENISLETCYKKEIIPSNPIIQMFNSSNSQEACLNGLHFDKALTNLKKIDLIVNFQNIDQLINYIISSYDLPNVLYQRLKKTRVTHFKKTKINFNTIKKYNELDLEMYKVLTKKNLYFKFPNTAKKRSKDNYFLYSIDYKVENHNKLLVSKDEFNTFSNFLIKNKFIIENVV